MANKLVNLWADSNADIIDDGADAVLTLTNLGAGNGLAVKGTTGGALMVSHTANSASTVAPLVLVASAASGVFLDFRGSVLSTASILSTAASTAGYVPVRIIGAGGEAVGFMPIFKGVV